MNPILLLMYSTISVATIFLMTIIIKYLKEKAIQKQQLRDQVLSDLAILSGGQVVTVSMLLVVREIVGPFQNVTLVASVFTFLQYYYTITLSCTVSVQLTQVLSVFYAAELSEWREDYLVLFHRLFVAILGVSSSGVVCYFKGGMCRPTNLYYYVLQEYNCKSQNSWKS